MLGAEQYGLYSLALSVANIAIGLSIFGLDAALVRYVAIQAGRRDEAGIWGTLQVGVGVATLLSTFTGTCIYALAFILAQNVFHEPRLAPLLQVVGLIVPILTMSEVLAGANRGFKRMDYPVIAQYVFQPVFRLVMIVALAISGFNVLLAIITYGLADLAASIILVYFINKRFPLKRPVTAARRDLRAILNFSFPVWISGLLVQFHNNIQTLFLGTLNTVLGAGIFSVASQITSVSGQFSSSINISSKPVIAEIHDRGDMKQLEHIYQTANKWSLTVQIPVFLTLVLLPAPILSLFGNSFTDGALALSILALADLISIGTGMGGIIIDMTGYTKLKLVNSIIRLVVFLGMDLLLIPRWGLLGASVAALVGEAMVNLLRLLQVFYLFRILPYNRSFIKPLTAGVLALGMVLFVKSWLSVEMNLLYVVINVCILMAVYAAVILLLRLSPEDHALLVRLWQRADRIVPKNKLSE
jgi:O-antigen/teichoic acid export membrane protein